MQNKYKRTPSKKQNSINMCSESSSLDKYKTRKNVKSNEYTMQIKRAPSNQFKKYLDDTQNIFYEDRLAAKRLKQIQIYKPILTKLAIFLFTFYAVIYTIDPYQDDCPPNAWCGAYIHCNNNYILNQQKKICQLDPQITLQANQFVISIIENIKYNIGNQQCWPHTEAQSYVNKKFKINQILQQSSITKKQLKEEVWKQFLSNKNQQKHRFYLNNYDQIHVTQKKYSISCNFYLFSKTKQFVIIVALSFLIVVVLSFINQKKKRHKKACQIYKYLHQSVKKNHKIDVKEELNKMQTKWPNLQLNSKLWSLIDNQRVKKAEIVYYEQSEALKWKLLI